MQRHYGDRGAALILLISIVAALVKVSEPVGEAAALAAASLLWLFDRTRSLSLNLYEHVHGESRDRGQAMIDLKAQYETKALRAGFERRARDERERRENKQDVFRHEGLLAGHR